MSLIGRLGKVVDLGLKAGDFSGLVMKKYKNCIMLDLPGAKACKLVWHYNGKVYIGEWEEEYMLKSGQGVEYVPQKYYYKGQFFVGKEERDRSDGQLWGSSVRGAVGTGRKARTGQAC